MSDSSTPVNASSNSSNIIHVSQACIQALDISPVKIAIDRLLANWESCADSDRQLQINLVWDKEEGDPRELSEISEVRLWFVRLDATYPWFCYLLDWRLELSRYAAMLVPHEFRREGDGYVLQYNPEALEIFVMQKVFAIALWLKSRGISSTAKLQQLTQSLGYEIDQAFFDLL
ncbi:MAG: CRR6 family NdhI maturation factor [Pseudanabaenaceae cyanobacterium bins.39]|nr:CRR6 family NdhI maturation factor [Pseudanabaenaceae cyanobacterium bins.39]